MKSEVKRIYMTGKKYFQVKKNKVPLLQLKTDKTGMKQYN